MMHTAEMMKVFAPYRGDAILVPGRSGRYWINLSDNHKPRCGARRPVDGRPRRPRFFGLALARPDKKVNVVRIPRATS